MIPADPHRRHLLIVTLTAVVAVLAAMAPVYAESGTASGVSLSHTSIRNMVDAFLSAPPGTAGATAESIRKLGIESVPVLEKIHAALSNVNKQKLTPVIDDIKRDQSPIPANKLTLVPPSAMLVVELTDYRRTIERIRHTALGKLIFSTPFQRFINKDIIENGPVSLMPDNVKKVIKLFHAHLGAPTVLAMTVKNYGERTLPSLFLLTALRDAENFDTDFEDIQPLLGPATGANAHRGVTYRQFLLANVMRWRHFLMMDVRTPFSIHDTPGVNIALDAVMDGPPPLPPELAVLSKEYQSRADILAYADIRKLFATIQPTQWHNSRYDALVSTAPVFYPLAFARGAFRIGGSLFYSDITAGIRTDEYLGLPVITGPLALISDVHNGLKPTAADAFAGIPADAVVAVRATLSARLFAGILRMTLPTEPNDAGASKKPNAPKPAVSGRASRQSERRTKLLELADSAGDDTLTVTLCVRYDTTCARYATVILLTGISDTLRPRVLDYLRYYRRSQIESGDIIPAGTIKSYIAKPAEKTDSSSDRGQRNSRVRIRRMESDDTPSPAMQRKIKQAETLAGKITAKLEADIGLSTLEIAGHQYHILAHTSYHDFVWNVSDDTLVLGDFINVMNYVTWYASPKKKSMANTETAKRFRDCGVKSAAAFAVVNTRFALKNYFKMLTLTGQLTAGRRSAGSALTRPLIAHPNIDRFLDALPPTIGTLSVAGNTVRLRTSSPMPMILFEGNTLNIRF